MINAITFVGVAASIFTATASIPQLVKIYKSKRAGDISILMILVLIVGLGLWVYYGILRKDWIIWVANCIPFIVNSTILFLTLRYRKREA